MKKLPSFQNNKDLLFYFKYMVTPVGRMKLIASDKGLSAILWDRGRPEKGLFSDLTEQENHPVLIQTEQQLREYFEGKRTSFSLTLDFNGTAFQKKVWDALLTIPWGETRTYQQIAKQIGSPDASRAVGAANGKNPISIVAPCHRVIGASGKLVGFGGGLENKAFLLKLENKKPT